MDVTRRWREGTRKTSFTYLLLDPRITENLAERHHLLSEGDTWSTFVQSVFYIGKGKNIRPYDHLYNAIKYYKSNTKTVDKKTNCILDIWQKRLGVVCLHVFNNVIPAEAYTREAAMISAINVRNLKNVKGGDFYGTAATWTEMEKNMYGTFLLKKAMNIYLQEGERQLRPDDL